MTSGLWNRLKEKRTYRILALALAAQLGNYGIVHAVEPVMTPTTLPNGAVIHQTTVGTGANQKTVADATISLRGQQNQIMDIKQNANVKTGLIDWKSFSIGSGATVNFIQPGTAYTMINRVVGNELSKIHGQINATGNVVLVNPNGIVFDGAKINVGGFAASTAKLNGFDINGTTPLGQPSFLNSDITQAAIEVKDTLIAAGYSRSVAVQSALKLDPKDIAVGYSDLTNKVRLYANGNINLNNATLIANDTTQYDGSSVKGLENIAATGNDSYSYSYVTVRPDMNADDMGTLKAEGNNYIVSRDNQIMYNPITITQTVQVDPTSDSGWKYVAADTLDVFKDTTPTNLKFDPVTGAPVTDDGQFYNIKDYKHSSVGQSYFNFNANIQNSTSDASKLSVSAQIQNDKGEWITRTVGVDGTVTENGVATGEKVTLIEGNASKGISEVALDLSGNHTHVIKIKDEEVVKVETSSSPDSLDYYMLVNNIAQLEQIDDPRYGNLNGSYVLGRTIDGKSESISYFTSVIPFAHVDETNYNQVERYIHTSDGTKNVLGTVDGYFTKDTGGLLTKHLNDETIIVQQDESTMRREHEGGSIVVNENFVTDTLDTPDSVTGSNTFVYDKTEDVKTVTSGDWTAKITFSEDKQNYTSAITKNVNGGTISNVSGETVDNTGNTMTKVYKEGSGEDAVEQKIVGTKTTDGLQLTQNLESIGTLSQTKTGDNSSALVLTKDVVTISSNDGQNISLVQDEKTTNLTISGSNKTAVLDTNVTGFDATQINAKLTASENTEANAKINGVDFTFTKSDDAYTITCTIETGRDDNNDPITDTITVSKNGENYVVTSSQGNKLTLETQIGTTGMSAQTLLNMTGETGVIDGLFATRAEGIEFANSYAGYQSNFDTAATQFNEYNSVYSTVRETMKDYRLSLAETTVLFDEAKGQFDHIAATKDSAPIGDEPKVSGKEYLFDGKNIVHANTWDKVEDKENEYKGFSPIGSESKPFTGYLWGNYNINNLYINRPDEDNVGLFGVIKNTGTSDNVYSLTLNNPTVIGKSNVGAIAGQLDGGNISWVHVRAKANNDKSSADYHAGTVEDETGIVKSIAGQMGAKDAAENIGGLVGLANNAARVRYSDNGSDSTNGVTVIGRNNAGTETDPFDGNITNVGGLVGSLIGKGEADNQKAQILNSSNTGKVYGEDVVGGIVGYADKADFAINTTSDNKTPSISNNAAVSGHDYVGGILGKAGSNIKLVGVYNSNEASKLASSKKDGSTITGNIDYIKEQLENTSEYGKITGHNYVGGILGGMTQAGVDEDGNPIEASDNNLIKTAYNAGNVTGANYVGGITGSLIGANSNIENSYNADNNTVIQEVFAGIDTVSNIVKGKTDLTIPINKDGETISVQIWKDFTPTQLEKAKTLMQYYSFYTVDENGDKKYYYYIPAEVDDTEARKGAPGLFVDVAGNDVTKNAIATSLDERVYAVRMGYRDANVTANENYAGGLVGEMLSGQIKTSYNAGTVTVGDSGVKGGLVGAATTTVSESVVQGKVNAKFETEKENIASAYETLVDAKYSEYVSNTKSDNIYSSKVDEAYSTYKNSIVKITKVKFKKVLPNMLKMMPIRPKSLINLTNIKMLKIKYMKLV